MILNEEQHLEHYGTPRHSGRYPWGSGKNPEERNRSFLRVIKELKDKGLTEKQIADSFSTPEHPFTTTHLRALKSIAVNEERQAKIAQVQRLTDKGWGPTAISRHMGIPEPTVRSFQAPGAKDKADVLQSTARMLKDSVDKKTYLDVGTGNEAHLGITYTKLKTAVAMLQEEGYKVHYVKVRQLGTGKMTTQKVLTKPGVPYSEVYANRGKIKTIQNHSEDGGRSWLGIVEPLSISSKRIKINYAEDGGGAADGVIYVRPGVKDLSMGKSNYAQVRIKVDGTHYLKGMAIVTDGLPPGKDLVFNTNKSNKGDPKSVMKELKDDPDNPFGAMISRQITETGKDGIDRATSAMNIVNEKGDWSTWSRSLSSQMLSKQDQKLARRQLNMTYEQRVNELDTIRQLTNPAIKRKLLETYADGTDAAAVHLKAAALPRQASHVILPVGSMKPNEVYAPNYHTGDSVVLIRYPHGGTFEIPRLTVNNRNPEARKLIGHESPDAIGIHPDVAHHLSGADFDGDTVLVIPDRHGQIKNSSPLEGLKNFDPQREFPPYDGMKTIDGGIYHKHSDSVDYGKSEDGSDRQPNKSNKQHEMGNITNLIADMTIRGATDEEKARAVRHSMVVIDAEKHNLDYRASAAQNGIASLKAKYQGIPSGSKVPSRAGASTLITRAASDTRVPKRKARPAKEGGPIDRVTGEKRFVPTGETYIDKRTGKLVVATERSQKLAEETDAHVLSSGTPIERVYADHSNRLKALANEARKESLSIKNIPMSDSAKRVYAKQVVELNAALRTAIANRPRERQAQVLANAIVEQKKQDNPNMDPDTKKKVESQALMAARIRTGADKELIVITPEQWAAIQAGAISNHKLTQIINNTDLDKLKELALPKTEKLVTSTKLARAQLMLADGYTQAEAASQIGVSVTTLRDALKKAGAYAD